VPSESLFDILIVPVLVVAHKLKASSKVGSELPGIRVEKLSAIFPRLA